MKVADAQDIEQMWHCLFFRCCICKPQKMISVVEDDNWNVQCGYIISLYRDDNTFSAIAWKSIITKSCQKHTSCWKVGIRASALIILYDQITYLEIGRKRLEIDVYNSWNDSKERGLFNRMV